jgi:hypothetical protein
MVFVPGTFMSLTFMSLKESSGLTVSPAGGAISCFGELR